MDIAEFAADQASSNEENAERLTLDIHIPSLSTTKKLEFELKMTVQEAKNLVVKEIIRWKGPCPDYGLYYAEEKGFLDETKTLESYNLAPDTELEFKLRSKNEPVYLAQNQEDKSWKKFFFKKGTRESSYSQLNNTGAKARSQRAGTDVPSRKKSAISPGPIAAGNDIVAPAGLIMSKAGTKVTIPVGQFHMHAPADPMAPHLILTGEEGSLKGKVFHVSVAGAKIGRSMTTNNTIVIPSSITSSDGDDSVSRDKIVIYFHLGQFYVRNLSTTAPTLINTDDPLKKIKLYGPNDVCILRSGDIIKLGLKTSIKCVINIPDPNYSHIVPRPEDKDTKEVKIDDNPEIPDPVLANDEDIDLSSAADMQRDLQRKKAKKKERESKGGSVFTNFDITSADKSNLSVKVYYDVCKDENMMGEITINSEITIKQVRDMIQTELVHNAMQGFTMKKDGELLIPDSKNENLAADFFESSENYIVISLFELP